MRLLQLRADNFRLFRQLSLRAHRRLNFVFGPNAAGKTTLLETIYCLGRAKSFRGNSPQELAGEAGRQWRLLGRVAETASGLDHRVGIGWTAEDGSRIHVDDKTSSALDLLRLLPVQILEPGMHRVLQDGPTYRRSFLDWGVFHVEQSFLPTWRRYRRALRQRNQSLRSGARDQVLAAWEPELAGAGQQLHALRLAHLQQIRPRVTALVEDLLDEGEWRFDLHPGWVGESLAEALARQRTADRRVGTTHAGSHRAELRIRAGEHGIRNRISRGQQKLLVAALLIAQCEEVGRKSGRHPILLVDDFAAELAPTYQKAFLQALNGYPGQVFVTAFDTDGVLAHVPDCAMFHVEHGVLASRSAG